MRTLSNDLAHALAAEYVVGTLRGRARQRFQRMFGADPGLAAIVRRWEAGLAPLAAGIAPVSPPARVWKAIESRIAPRAEAAPAALGFWRSLGMVASGLAVVLLCAFLWLSSGPRGEPLFVAVLTAPDSVPRMVVTMHAPDTLRVRMVKPWADTQGNSLELWVLPTDGKPRSLGLVANTPGDTLIRMTPDDPRVRAVGAFAVSLEPAGGSPTKAPTGPVLCIGNVAKVRGQTPVSSLGV